MVIHVLTVRPRQPVVSVPACDHVQYRLLELEFKLLGRAHSGWCLFVVQIMLGIYHGGARERIATGAEDRGGETGERRTIRWCLAQR